MATWQTETLTQLRTALGGTATVEPYGSLLTEELLDGWSDLDVEIVLSRPITIGRLGLDPEPGQNPEVDSNHLWAWQSSVSDDSQTVRLVLTDGRRVDLKVRGDVINLPHPEPDTAVRFDAALAASRFGRGDRLIGLHLTLGILRECLVIAMLLRDRAAGTNRHRHGGPFDDRAAEVAKIARLAEQQSGEQRPTVIEEACRLYGHWRTELHPAYRPDWSGLAAVITRGTTN